MRTARLVCLTATLAAAAPLWTTAVRADEVANLETQLRSWIEHLPPRRSPLADEAGRAGLEATQTWLVETLTQMGYTPKTLPIDWRPDRLPRVAEGTRLQIRPAEDGRFTVETVPNPQPVVWRNVVVEIPGTTRPEEIVVVGAHFDSVPTTPGADDNGSGTAALLAIAQRLAGRRFDRTVQLAFYNLEEVGLVGSRVHAQRLQQRAQRRGERVVAMLSLEMLGYYSDEPNSQRIPIPEIPGVFENPPTVGDFLAVVGNQASASLAHAVTQAVRQVSPGLKLFVVDFVPATGWTMPDTRRSDHAPFWDMGWPALLVTDTSEFRTPHYHKPSDTLQTLDLRRLALAAKGLAAAVERLASAASQP